MICNFIRTDKIINDRYNLETRANSLSIKGKIIKINGATLPKSMWQIKNDRYNLDPCSNVLSKKVNLMTLIRTK